MSSRSKPSKTADAIAAPRPCDMPWNGRTWQDMPGVGEDNKRLNFFFWRRGVLDVEDEVKCEQLAHDGISEVEAGAKPKPRLVLRASARFGSRGRRRVRDYEEEREAKEKSRHEAEREAAAEEAFRAALKLRLVDWRGKHVSAMRQIADMTGANYDNLCKFIHTGKKVALEKLREVAALLDELDEGTKVLSDSRKGRHDRVVEVPAGHMPFKEWVRQQAALLGLKPHSMYARLNREPSLMPPVHKVHGRAWFVKIQSEVAA